MVTLLVLLVVIGVLHIILHTTQSKSEPQILSAAIPFLDPAISIAKDKVDYLVNLRYV